MVREKKTNSAQTLCIRKLGVEIQSPQPSTPSSRDWVVPTASSATASGAMFFFFTHRSVVRITDQSGNTKLNQIMHIL